MKWHSSLNIDFPEELMELYLTDDSLTRLRYKIENGLVDSSDFIPPTNAQVRQESYRNKIDFAKNVLPNIHVPQSPVSDLKVIDPEFLINNIETAFSVRQNRYNAHLGFEQFCEYVLPYRCSNEPIINIRHILQKKYSKFLSDNHIQDPTASIMAFNSLFRRMMYQPNAADSVNMPDLGFYNILFRNLVDCKEHVIYATWILRSIGMPCAFDFTPQWLERESRHFWFTTSNDSANIPVFGIFIRDDNTESKKLLNMASTVFRKTFEVNKETPFFLKSKAEPVPAKLSSTCIKNVTEEYHQVSNVTLNISGTPDNYNLCYFCIFTTNGWSPVQWGKMNRTREKVEFEKLPVNVVGIPCFYNGDTMIPCGKLIQVKKNDKYSAIRADVGKTINLKLFRKYPYKYGMYKHAFNIPTSYVQGSNYADFIINDTLLVINDTLPPFLNEYKLNNRKFYRYYRLNKNREVYPRWSNVAELIFLSSQNINERKTTREDQLIITKVSLDSVDYKLTGKAIGINKYKVAFDNNMETFSNASWIGMDFEKPVKITKIRIAPRNANNIIIEGDTYELLYWNERWISAGKKTAKNNFLEFGNIPSKTIYWLKNLTRGKEELPFFYEDGVQYFTNHDDFLLDENFIRFNNKVNQLVLK